MKKLLGLGLTVLFVLTAVGCGGNGSYNRGKYLDPDEETPVGNYYSDTDLKLVSEAMFQSLVSHPKIAEAGEAPVLMVMLVENRTRDRIDMEGLTNKIATALMRTGKVRFVNKRLRDGLMQEYEYNRSGVIDPSTAKHPGSQIAPDYILSGIFSSIEMPRGKEKSIYYRLTMQLTDVLTNLIVWQDEKEIKKLLRK